MTYKIAQTWIKSATSSDITVTCLDEKENKVDFKSHKLMIFPFLTQSCLLTSDDYEDIDQVILPDVSPHYFNKFLNSTYKKLEDSNEDYFAFFSSKHVVVSPAATADVKMNEDDGGGGEGDIGGGGGGGLVGEDLKSPSRPVKNETSLLEKHDKKMVNDRSLCEREMTENQEPIKIEFMKEETTEEITDEKIPEKSSSPHKTDILENDLFHCTFCTEVFPKTNFQKRNKHMLDVHYSELEAAGRIYKEKRITEGVRRILIKWYKCDYEGCENR